MLDSILKELEEFEQFTIELPTDKHAIHIKHILKTNNAQSMIKSLEMIKRPSRVIFWVLDDSSVALGELNS
jgi:rRNA processing protein Krr1/Pno1